MMWNGNWTNDGMMGWGDGAWHWLFGFHGILSLLLLAVIVALIVALVRDSSNDRGSRTGLATRDQD